MFGDIISIDVDVNDILPELDKDTVAEYFKLESFDDSNPYSLIKHMKKILGHKRPMLPEDVKEMLCDWIDNNLYTCI